MEDAPEEIALSEWIDASASLDLLEPHFAGSAATKAFIADKLLDGKLTARAAKLWETEESTLTLKNSPSDPAEVEMDVTIERKVWKSSRFWIDDVSLWRWPENRFVVTQTKRPPERTILEGVQFSRAQVTAMCASRSIGRAPASARGRHVKMDAWVSFYHAVIEIARDKRLVAGQFESQADLLNTLMDMLPEKTLGKRTMEPRVQQIWNRYMTGND